MKAQNILILATSLALLSPIKTIAQPTVTFTTLVSFNGTNGSSPRGELMLGLDGNFYGTTAHGGTNNSNAGTVFRISLDGSLTSLVSFDTVNGWEPECGLTSDLQGNLYGCSTAGGTNAYPYGGNSGNIFEFTAGETLISTLSFNNVNGAFPQGRLQLGRDGNFYGTTQTGGTNLDTQTVDTNIDVYGIGDGTVFRITPDGKLTSLFEFNWTNGSFPVAALLLGQDGSIYGTTQNGGPNDGYGTVFKLATNGTLTTLVSFNGTNGAGPAAGPLPGRDGNLYGTTMTGGTNMNVGVLGIRNDTNAVLGYGTLYRLSADGTLTTLVYFNSTNGAYPQGSLLFGPDGNIYGTTSGYPGWAGNGSVFQLKPDGTLNTLVLFNGTNGANPYAGLTLGPDGNLYGTTYSGGQYGDGTIFRLTVPMAPVLQSIPSGPGQIAFSWNSASGLNYQVQYSTDLSSTNWANVGSVLTATNGTTFQTNAVTDAQGFYRVLLVP